MALSWAARHAAAQVRLAVRAHLRLTNPSRAPLARERGRVDHLPPQGESTLALVVDTKRALERLSERDQRLVVAIAVEGRSMREAAAFAGYAERTAIRQYPVLLTLLADLLWPYA